MNIFYIFLIIFFASISSQKLLSESVFDSNFIDINIESLNANETKMSSINDVKNITIMNLTNKILDNKSKKKLYKIIEAGVNSDQFIQNIIIENEIITNEKYIAKIKINLNKEKFVNLLRDNKINYTDIQSKPFLVISSYNINFIKIGLNKKKSFNNFLKQKKIIKKSLVKYSFPSLDANDRYILPYEKILKKDINGFNTLLNKYNLDQLILINILKSNTTNQTNVNISIYINEKFTTIGDINLKNNNFESQNKLFEFISDKLLIYINDWWKKKYQINNSVFNKIECRILSKNFEDLIKIKSDINNLSQVKYIKTKKIQLNSNIVDIFYYGNFDVLHESLFLTNNFYKEKNGCIIFN